MRNDLRGYQATLIISANQQLLCEHCVKVMYEWLLLCVGSQCTCNHLLQLHSFSSCVLLYCYADDYFFDTVIPAISPLTTGVS